MRLHTRYQPIQANQEINLASICLSHRICLPKMFAVGGWPSLHFARFTWVAAYMAFMAVVLLLAGCATAISPSSTPSSTPSPALPPRPDPSPTHALPSPSPTKPLSSSSLVSPTQAIGPFTGRLVRVLVEEDMRDAVEAQAGRFQQQTGAWVAITSVSFSSLPTMLNTVVLTDTFRYDVVVLPGGWVRDVAATGYVANLSQLVQHDALTPSNEQPSVFRGITMGDNGHLYAISLRTSLPLLRYRDDLLAQYRIPPPTTWEDYIAVTRTFNGRDLNRDGEPDYGSCLALSPEILPYHLVWAIAGGYLQTHGHQQGVFFDHETMQPTAATAGFRAAFDVFKAIMRYAPPQQQQFTRADARRLFGEGRCALTIEWDGVQPTGGAYDGVITPLPGSDMVFDPQRGSIQPCSQDNQGRYTRCPHAINGVNYALYGGYGGWAGSIHAHAPPSTQEVGLAFLLSLRNAMNEGQAQEASDALLNGDNEVARRVLTTPNWIHPLTIAHHWYYQQTMQRVLRETLLSPVEEGSEDMGDSTGGSIEAAQRISAVWEQITEMAGREAQREQYRTMLAEAP